MENSDAIEDLVPADADDPVTSENDHKNDASDAEEEALDMHSKNIQQARCVDSSKSAHFFHSPLFFNIDSIMN